MIEGAQMVRVTWHDAHSASHWQEVRDIDADPYVVETVGWLLPGTKPDHVVIAQSVGSDDSIDGIVSIPVGVVVALKLLGS
jgi:hypothetical protein